MPERIICERRRSTRKAATAALAGIAFMAAGCGGNSQPEANPSTVGGQADSLQSTVPRPKIFNYASLPERPKHRIFAMIVSGTDRLGSYNVDLKEQPAPTDAVPPGSDKSYLENGDQVAVACYTPTVNQSKSRPRTIGDDIWLGVVAKDASSGFIHEKEIGGIDQERSGLERCKISSLQE